MNGKYASALFVAAAKAKQLDVVGKELEQLEQLIKSNAEFRTFLKDPVIPPAVKRKGLEEFFKGAGASDITVNFFGEDASSCLTLESVRLFLSCLEASFQSWHILLQPYRTCEDQVSRSGDFKRLEQAEGVTLTSIVLQIPAVLCSG